MSDTHTTVITRVEPTEGRALHPIVQAAMEQGSIDPQTLRELLAVQREWEAGEARKAYTRALAALKRDLPTVLKHDRTVDFTSNSGKRTHYTHTSLAAVMDQITEPLTSHGFSLSWTPETLEKGGVRVTCRLTHTEGHFQEAAIEAPADTSGNKNPAQAIASTITLLSRYTALSLLGIATTDMQEPTGEQRDPSSHIDSQRNLRAAAKLTRYGKTREAAEAYVGKPVAQWTGADIERLRAWVEPVPPPAAEEREPGSDG